jgi:hypothetical protein
MDEISFMFGSKLVKFRSAMAEVSYTLLFQIMHSMLNCVMDVNTSKGRYKFDLINSRFSRPGSRILVIKGD